MKLFLASLTALIGAVALWLAFVGFVVWGITSIIVSVIR